MSFSCFGSRVGIILSFCVHSRHAACSVHVSPITFQTVFTYMLRFYLDSIYILFRVNVALGSFSCEFHLILVWMVVLASISYGTQLIWSCIRTVLYYLQFRSIASYFERIIVIWVVCVFHGNSLHVMVVTVSYVFDFPIDVNPLPVFLKYHLMLVITSYSIACFAY